MLIFSHSLLILTALINIEVHNIDSYLFLKFFIGFMRNSSYHTLATNEKETVAYI